jgi:predicted nuclease of predicted toxin-antitoxin system
MILADENILSYTIDSLRANGHDVFSIKESLRGCTDVSIANLFLNPSRIILTEDKDFGEIAFSKNINLTGCILLRYVPFNEERIITLHLQF